MKLNTPNKLTLLRMILVPFFVVFLSVDAIPHRYLWALVFFSVASFTDFLDGHLARKHNLVTNFGKFLDPLADKLLVISALMCFVESELLSAIAVIITIAREFAVTSVRLVSAGSGVVIPADIWGKVKTVTQIIGIIAVMFMQELLEIGVLPESFPAGIIGEVLIWISVVCAVVSGVRYVYYNWSHIKTDE